MADTPLERVIPNPQSAHSHVGPGRDREGEWIDKINCGNKFLAENSPQLYIFGPESARKWDPLCCLSPSSPNSSMSFGVSLFCLGRKWQTIKTFHLFYFTAKARPNPQACLRSGQCVGAWGIPERCNHRVME